MVNTPITNSLQAFDRLPSQNVNTNDDVNEAVKTFKSWVERHKVDFKTIRNQEDYAKKIESYMSKIKYMLDDEKYSKLYSKNVQTLALERIQSEFPTYASLSVSRSNQVSLRMEQLLDLLYQDESTLIDLSFSPDEISEAQNIAKARKNRVQADKMASSTYDKKSDILPSKQGGLINLLCNNNELNSSLNFYKSSNGQISGNESFSTNQPNPLATVTDKDEIYDQFTEQLEWRYSTIIHDMNAASNAETHRCQQNNLIFLAERTLTGMYQARNSTTNTNWSPIYHKVFQKFLDSLPKFTPKNTNFTG